MPVRPPSSVYIGVLVATMLVSGASNSLWSKFQDMQCVADCDGPSPRLFEQPTYQTLTMFFGETACLIAFKLIASRFNPFRVHKRAVASGNVKRVAAHDNSARLAAPPLSDPNESAFAFGESAISLRNDALYDSAGPAGPKAHVDEDASKALTWSQALPFWAPAVCDICGTTAMNIGLFFVPVSVYQMLRGCLVLWVGLFSVLFLKRKLLRAQWAALFTVILGVAIVGLSSVVGAEKEVERTLVAGETQRDPTLGVFLITTAQILYASVQPPSPNLRDSMLTLFVLEEKIMEQHSVDPLLAVGYEGSFGAMTTIVGMLIAQLVYGSTPAGKGGYFDVYEGFDQIVHNSTVWATSIAIMISIALFNFCGLAVTKTLSATARSTIDTSRTCLIWAVSLLLGWETFKLLQVVGFALLVYGTCIYNELWRFPTWTNLHAHAAPAITLATAEEDSDDARDTAALGRSEDDDDDDDGESALYARSRSVDAVVGRPVTRRSGSGRRGEVSPLLKNVVE